MRKLFILLLLFSALFAEEFTYIIHSMSGELSFDEQTKEGTLRLRGVNDLVPLFNIGEQRNMGFTHLSTFLQKWKGPAYAMVAYYGLDAEKNVYHSIPVQLGSARMKPGLVFTIKVLNDLQVMPKTNLGETLLYIDNYAGADPGCLFPGAGWSTPGCHNK